jgi:cell division transport system ATP-binding protein
LVRLDDVSLHYDQGPEVLRHVSCQLVPGSFHFLVGPSGAGKSSLLKLLYLGQQPSAGRISLFGRDITGLNRHERALVRRRVGVVFQDFRLIEHLNAFDNVALPLRLAGESGATVKKKVAELMDWVGLADCHKSPPSTLSGGQQQRLAIARAVVARPHLLLADEPTGNVDDAIGTRLLHLFQEMHRSGTTVLIATHNEPLVSRFPQPKIRLQDGRISGLGPDSRLAGARR